MNELFNSLYWREPLWLLLSLLPALILVWKKTGQQHSLRQYADAELLAWITIPAVEKKSQWQNILQLLIWILFATAAAGPRLLILKPNELLPSQAAAIIIVDHSRSMQANDLHPNRQQIADNMVTQWSQQKNNIKLGIIIFAGASHIVLPATLDKNALHEVAKLLNKIQLPTHGSAMISAILQAMSLLKDIPGERSIILLTDGDIPDAEFTYLHKTLPDLQKHNISLRILGTGGLSPIPLSDTAGHWLQYNNKAVLTHLKERELKLLAKNSNVYYTRLNPDSHKELNNVWQPKKQIISKNKQLSANWNELFYWPLLTALFLIILKQVSTPEWTALNPLLIFLFSFILISQPESAYANSKPSKTEIINAAYKAWQNKNYKHAAKYYAQIKGYTARMGEGASCFREQAFECAIRSFSQAAWEAKNDTQHGEAAFNLANSFFKQGDFKSAINLYKDALRYQPKQPDYENNLKFTVEVQHNIERFQRMKAKRNEALQNGIGEKESSIDLDNDRVSTMDIKSSDRALVRALNISKHSKLTEQQLAKYMQISQNFAKLSTSKTINQQHKYDWSRFSNENPAAASKVKFWQRLFELEENIPAHPEAPKILQGVRPW